MRKANVINLLSAKFFAFHFIPFFGCVGRRRTVISAIPFDMFQVVFGVATATFSLVGEPRAAAAEQRKRTTSHLILINILFIFIPIFWQTWTLQTSR